MRKLTTLTLVSILIASCSGEWKNGINGNGNYVALNRSVGEYESLDLSSFFDVELINGNEGQLILHGEENLLEFIITKVENGKLKLKTIDGINLRPSNWECGIRIIVPVESLESISISGSGNIRGEELIKSPEFTITMAGSGNIKLDLETDSLIANTSGSGDINIRGRATNLQTTNSGSGDIDAYEMEASNLVATISGSGDIKVNVKEMLTARISGSGNIGYRGNPKKVDAKTSGSGNISK